MAHKILKFTDKIPNLKSGKDISKAQSDFYSALTPRLATEDDLRWICNKDEFKVDL